MHVYGSLFLFFVYTTVIVHYMLPSHMGNFYFLFMFIDEMSHILYCVILVTSHVIDTFVRQQFDWKNE